MDLILIPGLWLTGSAWTAVTARLESLGHHPVALTLPGQGDGRREATLADQMAAVTTAVDAASRPLVVGHSAAASLAWMAADARPESVAGVVMVGGFPTGDGQPYFSSFPVDGTVAFPGWEAFEGPDAADLDDDQRRDIQAAMVPVPATVTAGIVRLADPRRYDVPVTLVCPEFSPGQAREWVETGDIPELSQARRVDYADIDSGHWPMFSRPDLLAELLTGVADA